MSGWDALSEEALERLEAWPAKARELFQELVEDAPSELQRELLQRAVAAGHSPAEIHAFADELRGLADDQVFDACTLDADAPEGYTVVQLLRAEGDPLYAYELKGNTLSPADDDSGVGASPTLELESMPYVPPPPPPTSLSGAYKRPTFDSGPEPSAGKGKPLGYDAVTPTSGRHKRVDPNDLGQSIDATPRARPASGPTQAVMPGPVATRLMEDLLNEAVRGLGVTYREQDVDDAGLTLEAALGSAAAAVGRGIPVPIALGPAVAAHRRLALILQTSTSSGKRAWQLYDPFSGELYWVSEGDLLARTELPFSIKTNRRITRIALPLVKASSL
ncbi:MAG: hypothetical protein H6Q89_2369 [Myxococcaceae bacterium]|nr:hypothetical protein [Myxococcaceae bacterium]